MPVQRRILGAAAILLIASAVVLWLCQPAAGGPWELLWLDAMGFSWRMGAVLAAAWLAYEDVQRIPGWLLLFVAVAITVLWRLKWLLLFLLPLLILYAVGRRLLTPPKGQNRR
jgi:hypothetical protein